MLLKWQVGAAASCLHAAEAVFRGRHLADERLATALAGPVEKLRAALTDERIPEAKFWAHVLPQAVGVASIRSLAELTLIKLIGRAETPLRLRRFETVLTEVKEAYAVVVVDADKAQAARIMPLKQAWDFQGAGLLNGIRNATEEDILVSEAGVVVVYPAREGGGTAYLRYNQVLIEGVTGEPVPGLPEVVRLCWLLSTLNLDLPRYSEGLKNVDLAAGLAMIPPALTAAENVGLARADEAAVAAAVAAWLDARQEEASWASLLNQWWGVYRTMRPEWSTALASLDQMLAENA
jgi:hypothetical protein